MKLIYIIENGNRHKKIGVTANIQKRMTQLNTAISTGIRSVIISDFMPNAYTLEKQLHEANKEHRLNGEWFREIVDFCDIEFFDLEPKLRKNNCYLEDLGTFKYLTADEVKILIYVAATVTYDGEVVLATAIRRRIAESAGCKIQSVTNAIYTFLAAGILKRVEATIFALNPDYFAKGAWRVIREQRKAFQSITTYYPNGAKKR